MKIEDWKKILSKSKLSWKTTGTAKYKVVKHPKGLKWCIYDFASMHRCKTRGHCPNLPKVLEITFTKPREHLTVFEVEMLAMLILENKRVRDYAEWEKCPYGKEFIENIDTILEL